MPRHWPHAILTMLLAASALAGDANRLVYLDSDDPFYVGRHFSRLATPQWIGEPGVDAVIVLAIDDMREPARYEQYLRPILDRLKRIDGRAPLSIMTNRVDPADPQLPSWLAEGLSLETHTLDHPCPLLAGGDFEKAKRTYDECIDLLTRVPGNRPVAFRMPCCDSLNTPSPRFFAEIFNRTTPAGNFLAISSSVFQVFTPNDPELPRDSVLDAQGRDRFAKYLPRERSFATYVEDYPYPFVIGGLCWEFPCVVPSDWQAQHLHQPFNPRTVEDLQAAVDATVAKRGVLNLVFHPHGWIRSDQIVSLIDHATARHGGRVRFLSFAEALDRLETHLLGGRSLRAADGGDNGVRLIDLNDDGFLDVVIGNDEVLETRVWTPETATWRITGFPTKLVRQTARRPGVRFGIVRGDGRVSVLIHSEQESGGWTFDGHDWSPDSALTAGLVQDGVELWTEVDGRDRGARLRDLDGDGACELIVSNREQNHVMKYDAEKDRWAPLVFGLPEGTAIVDGQGRDAGLRFVDVDEDGRDDVLFADERRSKLCLWSNAADGWSLSAIDAAAGEETSLPPIVRDGANNGAWFHDRCLWVQNETTDRMPDLVDRRTFNEMLAAVEPRAKSPEASRRTIRTNPGFAVELVAAEPLVRDPVAFDWGPDGRLWVVEMGDYPDGADRAGTPGGRIRVLSDSDGDGRYDQSSLFLEGLSFPTGVFVWGNGALVTCAPEILYVEDSDGDGRADRREDLFAGFGEGNQQHRVNGLRWGLDNWIHCANGDSGGTITSVKIGETTALGYRDFRIHPGEWSLDPLAGVTQFVRDRDDWDNWFGSQNSDPMFHFVLADRYLRRNPHVAAPAPTVDVSIAPGAAPVFPISRTLPRFNDFNVANRFTSASSAIIYRDELLGPDFIGNSFVCESVHNLVHREVVEPEGATFTSRRPDDERQSEFLASSDNWFRPVMVRTGPDGALWIADMYRAVIEHTEYIPTELHQQLDIHGGADMGRIYRVYPVGSPPRAIANLLELDVAGLAAALDSPNGVDRDRVQQLLVQRREAAAVPVLRRLAAESARPATRVQALCTLDGLGAIDAAALKTALVDQHAGVRRHAVRLSEGLLPGDDELASRLLDLIDDAEPQVRLQVAYTLGEWSDPRAGDALGRIALASRNDPYTTAAVLSSTTVEHLPRVIDIVLADVSEPPAESLIESLLELAAAYESNAALAKALAVVAVDDRAVAADAWRFRAVGGLIASLNRRGRSLKALRENASPELLAALDAVEPMFAVARDVAQNDTTDETLRVAALRLLGRDAESAQVDVDVLASLLDPRQSTGVQQAAVEALAELDDERAPAALIDGWPRLTPDQRSRVLDGLASRAAWIDKLFDAVESRRIPAAEIDAGRRQLLIDHPDPTVRDRAAALLAVATNTDRQVVVDDYLDALGTDGDALRGVAVFKQRCAVCHRLENVGAEVGPDLAALTDKSTAALLTAVLDPNRAVESKFVNYVAETTDGRVLTGLLGAESGASVTLVGQDGKQTTLLRNELAALASSGKSLMPEGLEKDISRAAMADLLAYLGQLRPPRRQFAGNEPKLIEPEGFRGEFWLLAADCAIYGVEIVFEPVYKNLGFWSGASDMAVWTIDVKQAGRYIVRLDYACDGEMAGNAFSLSIDGATLGGQVASTGNWDTYRQATIGVVRLEPGQKQVTLRPAGPVRGYLMDLKSVRITPEEND